MNSFIAWVGGKRLLAKTITAMMPEHRTYIEVFGGAGVYSSWGYGPSTKSRYSPDMEGLHEVRERLKRVYIDNLSYDRLIPNWDRKESLFYCDPPYYMLLGKTGRAYYQHEFTAQDHERLRDVLKGIDAKFILSYDDHPQIRKLYKRFNVRATAPVLYSTNNRPGVTAKRATEVLITNF